MSAAEAIEAARAAGIHIAIDGDDLVLEASATPSPVVLDLLSRNKAHVVAMLRRQKPVNEFGPSRSLKFQPGHEVDPGGVSPGSWHAEALRCRIVAVLDRLPAPRDHSGRRLIAETRKFLESRWWTEAIKCGWAPEELFGLDGSAPLDNHERWGMIVGLALAPRPGDAIEHLDAEHAVIRHAPSPKMKNTRRVERRFRPAETTVVWWRCSTLMGDVERLTVWNS